MKKILMKVLSGEGHTETICEDEKAVRGLVEANPNTVMVLPDGHVAHDVDELLEMIELGSNSEGIYDQLPQVDIYMLPIMVGG